MFWDVEHLDRIGCHPDIELLKSRPQSFFEINEEIPVFSDIVGIDKDANQVITKHFGLESPRSSNRLCRARDCPKFEALCKWLCFQPQH